MAFDSRAPRSQMMSEAPPRAGSGVRPSTPPPPTAAECPLRFAAQTDVGKQRNHNEDNYLVHQARRAHQVRCTVATAPSAGDIWLVTLRQGAAGALADTTLTCAIADTNTSAVSTGSVSITPGNVITASIDSSTGAGDPDANALITVSLCLGD